MTSPDGGYFGGAASGDHSLIALGGYASNDPGSTVSERNITFIDAAGTVLARHGVGGGSWAVAMTPDGAWTAVGSENEQLYLFKGTELFASGRPIAGNAQLRGIAVTDDGRYVAAAGAGVTLHDLSADDPISPIFEDRTTDQSRAVDFSDDGRYLAYGGRVGTSNMYVAVYDIQAGVRVFTDTISYPPEVNAELRMLSISPDGSTIVAGDWGGFVHHYERSGDTWERRQSFEVGSRVYWTDMDASGQTAIVGVQAAGLHLFDLSDGEMTLRWVRPGENDRWSTDGGQRVVSITPDGRLTAAGTRGGGGGGGKMLVVDSGGNLVFEARSDAVSTGVTCDTPNGQCPYIGENGASPEVWFVHVSDDGSRLVFASGSGSAYLYELR